MMSSIFRCGLAFAAIVAPSFVPSTGLAIPFTADVNNSSAWTTGSGAGANSSVTYGFDYSTLGIPQAPGSSTTTGIVMRSNTNSGAAAAQGITISPNGLTLSGDYVVRALMWGNSIGGWTTAGAVSGGAGSSQMMGIGVGYSGGTNWRGGAAVGGGSGVWFASASEGGFGPTSATIRDYSAFIGTGSNAANFITSTSAYFAGSQDNFNPYYSAAFPGQIVNTINGGTWASIQNQTVLTGTITEGISGMAWREYAIARTGSTVVWSISGTPIATLSGSSLSLDGGGSITYFDPTSSVATSPYVLGVVASYIVEVPEPSAVILTAAGGLGTGLIWRRRKKMRS